MLASFRAFGALAAFGAVGLCGVLGCGADAPEVTEFAPLTSAAAPAPSAQPPVIERVAIRPSSPAPGDTLVADVGATDADGDRLTLRYTWQLNGRTVGGDADRLSLSEAPKGSLVLVTVVAHDGSADSAPASAEVRIGNQPPRVDGVELDPAGEIHGDQDVHARVRASDPDRDELAFEHSWRVDGQLLADRGPLLPAAAFERGDRIELSVTATDGEATSEAWLGGPWIVANAPPAIVSSPDGTTADGRFEYAVRASDPDGDAHFGFRLLEGPPGMTIDAIDGVVRFEPRGRGPHSYDVAIEVDDRRGGRATQRFVLDIAGEDGERPAPPARASADR